MEKMGSRISNHRATCVNRLWLALRLRTFSVYVYLAAASASGSDKQSKVQQSSHAPQTSLAATSGFCSSST